MNTSRFVITSIALFSFLNICGQSWNILWDKQLGNQRMDYFKDVVEDKNGGYTVLGSIFLQNKTSYDFWLIHFNEKGDTIWTRTLGTDFNDIPKRLTQTDDGTYLITGNTKDEDSEKLILIKTDERGTEQWRKAFDDSVYTGEDVLALGTDEFLIAGSKGSGRDNMKLWLAKLDRNGEVIWEKLMNEKQNGCCKSVRKLPDGGYAIVGQIVEVGKKDCDIWIARLNASDDFIWEKRIHSPGNKAWPECLCCSPDSCFMIAGWQGVSLGDINAEESVFDYDLELVKVDKSGNVLWSKNFDKEGSEGGNAVVIRPDGSFLVAGIKATSYLGKIGPWLMQIDKDGNVLSETLLKMHFNPDQAIKVINSSDGGFIVIGPGIQEEQYSRCNGWIMKFAPM